MGKKESVSYIDDDFNWMIDCSLVIVLIKETKTFTCTIIGRRRRKEQAESFLGTMTFWSSFYTYTRAWVSISLCWFITATFQTEYSWSNTKTTTDRYISVVERKYVAKLYYYDLFVLYRTKKTLAVPMCHVTQSCYTRENNVNDDHIRFRFILCKSHCDLLLYV